MSVSLPNVKSMNSSVPQKEVRLYYKTNLNGFQKGMHELHQLVVNEINEGLDINTVWNTFRDGMWQNVNKFVPVQQRRFKSPTNCHGLTYLQGKLATNNESCTAF